MKKKNLVVSLMLIMVFILTACGKKQNINGDALKFKEEYESLNNKINSNDQIYRSVFIDLDNPFVYITAEELVEKIDNDETFYVYFGSKACPWCRSVIEKAIEISNDNGVSKIYYIDIWDEEGNEILRDKYIIDSDNELKQSIKGTDLYYEILSRFDNVLVDYTLKDKMGNEINIGEKRIYAPNFIYVKDGIAVALVQGISDKQKNSLGELTDEILEDEKEIFNDFFEEDCGC